MRSSHLLLTLIGLLALQGLQAQLDFVRCGTDELHAIKMQDPEYAAAHEEKNRRLEEYLATHTERLPDCAEILLIPVAVHYQDTGLDIACAVDMALDQIEILNNDFAGTNADIGNWTAAQPTFPGISNGESCIQFCLASLNHPAGFGLNDGDYAVTLDQTTGDSDAAWSGYMNFFVRDLGGGVLGYSPLGGSGNGDGIACTTGAFSSISCGGNTIDPPYDLGRTMCHEVGHYLNLEHPWGGGGCASTDDVADTPVTDQATYGCPTVGDVNCVNPTLWMSYMDYCDDACLYMFSAGQITRAEGHVNTSLQNLLNNSVTTCQEAACNGYEVDYNLTEESCPGNDGMVSFIVLEGNPPYSYSINGGASTQSGSLFAGLGSGDYELYVIDDADCLFEETVTIDQESAPLELLSTEPTWCGNDSGEVMLSLNLPGSFEYSLDGFSWQGSPNFTNVTAGTYQAVVRNASGCTGSTLVTVEDENDLGIFVDDYRNVNCPFTPNGMIKLGLSGGVPPFVFSLDDADQTFPVANFEGLEQGEHVVHVSDSRDCKAQYPFTIFENFSTFDDDCPCTVYVPNAVTMDGDGVNEHLDVVPSCPFSDYSLQIFDRWGRLIFETIDPGTRWNGRAAQSSNYYAEDGIYFYKVKLTWGAENGGANTEEFVGNVRLIR